MRDTTPEIEAMVRERYRAMTPAERFLIGVQMFDTARTIALASFPPGLSPQLGGRGVPGEGVRPLAAGYTFSKSTRSSTGSPCR
jgi:hypothetical protein